MKRLAAILLVVFSMTVLAFGQDDLPDVPDNANLRNDNIRQRSIELDRASTDLKKQRNSSETVVVRSGLNDRFADIQKDYKGLQVRRVFIRDGYATKEFKKLISSAEKIKKHAKELHKNLFTDKIEKKPKKDNEESETDTEKPDLGKMVAELDREIGAFINSKMFQNISVVDPKDAKVAHDRLVKIMFMGEEVAKLAKEARDSQ